MALLAEFFCGQDEGYLFLVRAEDNEPIVVTFSLKPVYDEFVEFMRSILDPSVSGLEVGPALSELAEQIVRHAQVDEHVWIVPHGMLHYVPFHGLRTSEGFLGHRNPISYTPSASALPVCRAGPRFDGKPALILGDPTEDLRYARREASIVGESFDAKPALGSMATKEYFYSELAHDPEYDLVHFACHGEAGSVILAPDNSLGQENSPERLTSDEILRRRINAALVTVSACDAGFAELEASDEMLGLTRALLYCGASTVLLSTWPVDDFSTYLFVVHCYDELQRMLEEGNGDKSSAVRAAQRFVHGIRLSDVVGLCDSGAERCASNNDIRGEIEFREEGAQFSFIAGDFEEAVHRYADVAQRLAALPGDTRDHVELLNERIEELEFRMVIDRPPIDYKVRPYSGVSHWGCFYLHGDWRL